MWFNTPNVTSILSPQSPQAVTPPLLIGNLATGGAITTNQLLLANSAIHLAQTTGAQIMTLPALWGMARDIILQNTGTASFTLFWVVTVAGAVVSCYWNTTTWIVTGDNKALSIPNSPLSTVLPIAIANLPTGGNIGTAPATVNISSAFRITQTTTNQIITFPNPTVNTTASRIQTLSSAVWNVDFTFYGNIIKAGQTAIAVWDGTIWSASSGWATSDTIQTANTTGSTVITAYTSVVIIPTLTGNITLTYPTPVGNIGKKITFIMTGVPNAFTITHTLGGGTVTLLNNGGELRVQNGALTVEAIDATNIRQVSNIGTTAVLSEKGSVYTTGAVAIGASNGSQATSVLVTGLTFTPQTSGDYSIDVNLGAESGGSADVQVPFALFNSLTPTVAIANSERRTGFRPGNLAGAFILAGSLNDIFPLVAGQTYQIRAWNPNGAGGVQITPPSVNGRNSLTWNKVSGFSPVTGQSVDYVTSVLSTNQNLTAAADIVFNQNTGGNIPLNIATGIFTLTGGKTYELDSMLTVFVNGGTATTNANVVYQWVDGVTNLPLSTNAGRGVGSPFTLGAGLIINGNSAANMIYTPSTNQTVKIRALSVNLGGSVTLAADGGASNRGSSYATIKQLGSSATTLNTRAMVQVTKVTVQSIASGVDVGISAWSAPVIDTTGSFNATTGIFTAPKTGKYRFNLSHISTASAWAINNTWAVRMYKNTVGTPAPGTGIDTRVYAQVAFTNQLSASGHTGVVDLLAGETLIPGVLHDRGSATNLAGANLTITEEVSTY